MNDPIVIDLLLAAVLALFIWLGARKGFVLTLCSLLAVVVALVGATLISNTLAPMVADALEPKVTAAIEEQLDTYIQEVSAAGGELSPVQVFAALKEKGGVYEWVAGQLEQVPGAADPIVGAASQAIARAARTVAEQLARGVIFSVAFLLVLIAWFFISHALDLVSKLPVIDSLNHTLGGVLGAVKGLVIVYAAAWVLCSLTGTVSPETAEKTYLLSFLLAHSPLELLSLT